MFCYISTSKKEIEKDIKPSLILDNKNQKLEDSKKLKKNIKKALVKRINLFNNKIKLKKENIYKNVNNHIVKKCIKKNDFRIFLYYKLKRKYDSKIYTYNVKKVNELIFNVPSKFTANFKDYLLIEEDGEFFKRQYFKKEFNKKFKKICFFYEKFAKSFPNYTILEEGKYMYKNIIKKQKMIDELQKIKEEEEGIYPKMDVSNETIFTNNTLESIINQKDSFWINNMKEIINLDLSRDDSKIIDKINILIKNINQLENINNEKRKITIYKKEFKNIRKLSKPMGVEKINPKLVKIKGKINQIKKYRNIYEFNKKPKSKSKNSKTIESSYNSFSTTLNNKSSNNKGILINIKNPNNTNFLEEKKDIYNKKKFFSKDLLYKTVSNEKRLERGFFNNLTNKNQKRIKDNIQYESKLSNSMIKNKIKNYFKINIYNILKNQGITIKRKNSNISYNITNYSMKDNIKKFSTHKKFISIFNNYINNNTNPIIYSYANGENTNLKNIKSGIPDMKKPYNKTNNHLNLKKIKKNVNINISQNRFLNNTFSLKKIIKYELNFINNNNKYKTKNFNFLKNNKNKINNKKDRKINSINNLKNLGVMNHLKTFTNIIKNKTNSNFYKNTESKHNLISQKKKNSRGKKIVISNRPIGRNDKISILKLPIENKSLSNKTFRKQLLFNK